MEIIYFIGGGVLAVGIGLSLYEWRKGRVFLKHDLTQGQNPNSEVARELERHHQAYREAIIRNIGGGGHL